VPEPHHNNPKTLTHRTLVGINWKFFTALTQSLMIFIVSIVLARLIPPEEFGLLGMAVIITGLADLFVSLGMGAAIIQRRQISVNHIRVAITLSTILGLLMTCLLWLLAAPIANIFDAPRVPSILKVVSLAFLLNGLSTTLQGLLRRNLQFKTLFFIDLSSYLLGYAAFSIPMAIFGFGVWSLVTGQLAKATIYCILLCIKSPLHKPLLRWKETLDLIGFGSGVSINSVINYAADNADYFMIGKYLSATYLGLYTRAYLLIKLPQRVSHLLSSVLFPAYSEIQDEKIKISEAYFKTINMLALIAFPALVGMAIGAKYIIVGLYGSNWAGAVPVFRILCIAGMLKITFPLAGSVVKATGKIYSEVKRQLIYLLLIIIGSYIGVRFGIKGVGIAVCIASLWLYFSMAQLTLNILGGNWKLFFKAQLPGISMAIIIGSIDLTLIIFFEYFLPTRFILLKLILLFSISVGTLLISLIYLPDYIKGEMPAWIFKKYSKCFPMALRAWLLQRL